MTEKKRLKEASKLIHRLLGFDYTQTQIAEELDIPYPYVSSWKNLKYKINDAQFQKLSDLVERVAPPDITDEEANVQDVDDANTFSILLNERMSELSINPRDLQKESGLALPTISRLLDSPEYKPHRNTIDKINLALKSIAKRKKQKIQLIYVHDDKVNWVFYGPYPYVSGANGFENAPEKAGVYCIYDHMARPLYIGKSKHLRTRLLQHAEEVHFASRKIVNSFGFILMPESELNSVEKAVTKLVGSGALLNYHNKYIV